MTRLLSRTTTLLSAALLLATTACSSTSGEATPSAPSDSLSRALALVPGTVTSIEFIDMAAAKSRWGLSDVTGLTPLNDPRAVDLRKRSQTFWTGTELDIQLAVLKDGWNGNDVDWSLHYAPDGPPVTLYRLRDGLDMSVVTTALAEGGMTRSGTDDVVRFVPKSLGAGTYGRVFLSGVTVIPAQHLLIAGAPEGWTAPGEGSSLAAQQAVPTLTAGLTTVDAVSMSVGTAACVDPMTALERRGTPTAVKALADRWAALDLQQISGSLVAADDRRVSVVTRYADDATAAKDLPARQKLLAGNSIVADIPYTDLFTATVQAAGPTLRYDLDAGLPARIRDVVQQRDTPWAFC